MSHLMRPTEHQLRLELQFLRPASLSGIFFGDWPHTFQAQTHPFFWEAHSTLPAPLVLLVALQYHGVVWYCRCYWQTTVAVPVLLWEDLLPKPVAHFCPLSSPMFRIYMKVRSYFWLRFSTSTLATLPCQMLAKVQICCRYWCRYSCPTSQTVCIFLLWPF